MSENNSEIKRGPGRPKKTEKHVEKDPKLKSGYKVRYKLESNNNWLTVKLISRSGKKAGIHDGEWNVMDENGTISVINFKKDNIICEILNNEQEVNIAEVEYEKVEEVYLVEDFIKQSTEKIKEAKIRELQSWKKNSVYTEVKDTGQYCVSSKWVVKPKQIDGVLSVKARLVLRGFEEEGDFRKDSPTCMRESLRLALVIIATNQWKINSTDFKTAFLQGYPIDRKVYVKPPKEAGSSGVWKLNKTAYGLKDAPREWYLRLRDVILKVGCKISITDGGLFIKHHEGKLDGLILIYVDDLLWGGTLNFVSEVVLKLKEVFEVSSEHSTAFQYLGIDMNQAEDYSICISQENYVNRLKHIPVSEERSRLKEEVINDEERQQLRSVVGKLNWLSGSTRPDISFNVGQISFGKKAKVKNLILANDVINQARNSQTDILFPKLKSMKDAYIVVFTDASFMNLEDGGSQGGHIIFVTDGVNCCPVTWQSRRIKRIVRSTLAAETLSLVEGCETGYMVRKLLNEILPTSDNCAEKPIICYTDNKSLYESAQTTNTVTDRRLLTEINIVRQMISRKEIELRWCCAANQTSDVLTKFGAAGGKLRSILHKGKFLTDLL